MDHKDPINEDKKLTTQFVDLNANKAAYIAAIEVRIESLITDLDQVPADSSDHFAIQTRLNDLSLLDSNIKMHYDQDRALALLEDRISRIEKFVIRDCLYNQRIDDLNHVKNVLLGPDDQ